MLYLLTWRFHGHRPAAWNDWTSHLLREFFLKVLNVLEKGELASEKAVATIERKRERSCHAASRRARAGRPFSRSCLHATCCRCDGEHPEPQLAFRLGG